MTITEIRKLTGMSRMAFAAKYSIPYRTIDDWENDRRTPPEWVPVILEKAIRFDTETADAGQ